MDGLLYAASIAKSTLPAVLLPIGPDQDRFLPLLRGPSESIGRLWSQVRRIAPEFRTLLLSGERGCGANMVAHLIYSLSPYRRGTLLRLCPSTAERHLRSPRRFLREVTGGVLYLPDVDQLSPQAQEDLLRYMHLNRSHPHALLAFSSRNLRPLAAAGGFSVALAESLSLLHVQIPSLRDRNQDVPSLAEFLLEEAYKAAGGTSPRLSPSFLEEASNFDWPGNLDQLCSIVLLLASRPHAGRLDAADFQNAVHQVQHAPVPTDYAAVRMIKLELVIQEHIRSVLLACHGNKLRAAEVLGISRSTLYRMLESGRVGTHAAVRQILSF